MPVQQLDKTLSFYKNVFGLPDLQVEEGMITVELPNLSLFLMEKGDFESYSKKQVVERHSPVKTQAASSVAP